MPIVLKEEFKVVMDRQLLEALLEGARRLHPREILLLLRGRKEKGEVEITEFLFPPFSARGKDFASFSVQALPLDPSLVGTAHSHPSGNLSPSPTDLNRFFGKVMLIMGFPYLNEENVAVYDGKGRRIPLSLR
ncbi:MAG: Mov34/MPN/PAD-1 family protein [Candidatus Hadarchaeales archaeon]